MEINLIDLSVFVVTVFVGFFIIALVLEKLKYDKETINESYV